MKTLDELGCECGTDRASNGWHDYLHTYDDVLGSLRDKPVTLVEIGVLGGAGIRTWSKWFTHPDTRIIGIDIETFRYSGCDDPRVAVIEADGTTAATAARLPAQIDVAIDDGSHFASHQFASFQNLWPRVKPGGFYAIEDLHTFASPQHCNARQTIMQWIAEKCESIQARGPLGQAKRLPGDSDIDWILVRKGLCIIRKAK